MNLKRIIASVSLLVFALSSSAWADSDPVAVLSKMVKDMEKEMSSMKETIDSQNEKIQNQSEKIRTLEIKGPQTTQTTQTTVVETGQPAVMTDKEFEDRLSTAVGGANKWLKDLKFSGDFRLRYDGQDYTSGNPAEPDPRNRFRFRLRYGFEKTFNDQMKVGFSMATAENQVGGTSTDPTSENQTFTNLFDYKNIWVDRAYATYTPNFAKIGPIEKLEITGGKFNNPFELGSSEIIWDRDVKPEGVYEKMNLSLIDTDSFDLKAYILGGQFILNENALLRSPNPANPARTGDSELWAIQGGINPVFYTPFLERPVEILSAVSYYDYQNYANNSNFTIAGTSLANGNPNVSGPATILDARAFRVIESYNEIAIYPYGMPTRFFVDVADNPASNPLHNQGPPTIFRSNFAWALGGRLGQMTKKGDWELRYEYRYIGSNAVVGAFSDSDFGNGYAGKKGSMMKLSYSITDSLIFSLTGFLVSNVNDGAAGIIDLEQRRMQADLLWKF